MGKDLAWLCAKVTTSLLFYPPQSVKQHVLVLQGVFWSRAGLIHCNGHYRMPKHVDLINMRHSDVCLRSVKAWVTTENKFQLKNLAHNDLKFGSVSDRNPTMWTIVKAFHSSTTTAQRQHNGTACPDLFWPPPKNDTGLTTCGTSHYELYELINCPHGLSISSLSLNFAHTLATSPC